MNSTEITLTNTKPLAAAGTATIGFDGTVIELTKTTIERTIITMFESNGSTIPNETWIQAEFMADLKKVSAQVKPGRKLSHEESIRHALETYPKALENLGK